MMRTIVDPLINSVHRLREALDTEEDVVSERLGELADTIKDQVGGTDQKKEKVGEINADFQNVPVVERRTEQMREKFIQLGEQIHQLRADFRRSDEIGPHDGSRLRAKAEQIANEVEAIRVADDKYVLDTVNSNPGSGE